jgi:hypothetical protein
MQLDGDATVGIFSAQRIRVADHGDAVAVIEVIITVRARDAPLEYFRQLSLCHESNISGGCDIVVDDTRMTRIPPF